MGERSNRATGGVRSLVREPLRMTRTLASLAAGFAGDVTALLKVCSHHAVKMATQFFFQIYCLQGGTYVFQRCSRKFEK